MAQGRVTDWDNAPVVLDVGEARQILGISRPTAYALFNSKDFPAVRISERRIVVSKEALRNWLQDKTITQK